MKKIIMGILAHVDAGKTTLSEGILYKSGTIRKVGRVDNKDAFLDTDVQERARGITIFSKQARFAWEDMEVTLLDTPGHVDFSTEMERTLQVLDYAILVISALDGVQGHTETLWKLLKEYEIPTFVFVNKMDQPGADKNQVLADLKRRLDDGCVDFTETDTEDFFEEVATTDEELLEQYLETGEISHDDIRDVIVERKLFPCFFGSALKLEGIEAFLDGISKYTEEMLYDDTFAARVFKITRDEQGNRLTHLKVTGGSLKVKELIKTSNWEEKVNQIRLYSGSKFEPIPVAEAGTVCAVTGLSQTKPGEGLGADSGDNAPMLEPVLTYRIQLPDGVDASVMLPKLRMLEEEDPMLSIDWKEELQEIHAKLMGEVQIEVLTNLVKERFDVDITFDEGNIVYKETISNVVEGVGHFEPLRHYAEVHLLMEPGEQGSGIVIDADCSEDLLDRNWQRLIVTHLYEREHRGVLTGAPITDIKITLKAGKAHLKHTEGGDFRQATYRAVRQGLRQAESVLLEPWYDFRLEIPEANIGRAMMDVEKMYGKVAIDYSETDENGNSVGSSLPGANLSAEDRMTVLKGSCPVSTMRGYPVELYSYTRGRGRLFCTLKGYAPCHNAAEIIEAAAYIPEADLEHPTGSVFCSHGAGVNIPWDEVKDHMHLPSILAPVKENEWDDMDYIPSEREEMWIGQDEVDAIISRTFYSNQSSKAAFNRKRYKKSRNKSGENQGYLFSSGNSTGGRYGSNSYSNSGSVTYFSKEDRRKDLSYTVSREKKEEFLLVDGYNIIFAWDDLKELAENNIDSARDKLMDILCNYQGYKKCQLMVVFDAYRVKGHDTEVSEFHNIFVVYTKEAETADSYIEKFAHKNSNKYDITVATSDRLEQMIIMGQGCRAMSARSLKEEVQHAVKELRNELEANNPKEKHTIGDALSQDILKKLYSDMEE